MAGNSTKLSSCLSYPYEDKEEWTNDSGERRVREGKGARMTIFRDSPGRENLQNSPIVSPLFSVRKGRVWTRRKMRRVPEGTGIGMPHFRVSPGRGNIQNSPLVSSLLSASEGEREREATRESSGRRRSWNTLSSSCKTLLLSLQPAR